MHYRQFEVSTATALATVKARNILEAVQYHGIFKDFRSKFKEDHKFTDEASVKSSLESQGTVSVYETLNPGTNTETVVYYAGRQCRFEPKMSEDDDGEETYVRTEVSLVVNAITADPE